MYFTCSRSLRASVPSCLCLLLGFSFLCALRASIFLRALRALFFNVLYVPSFFWGTLRTLIFFTWLAWPHFFTCLTCLFFFFFTCLCAFIFHVPYVSSFFTGLTCPHFHLPYASLFFYVAYMTSFLYVPYVPLLFSSVSNFYRVLRSFAFLFEIWYNPEPTAISRNKQDRDRINRK